MSLWRPLRITDEEGKVDRVALVRIGVQMLLAAAAVGALLRGQWLNGLLVLGILALTLLPRLLGRRFPVQVPQVFGVLTVLFVVASLFLGEIRGYYVRFWWWDLFLHAGSGFLLGVIGFLLVYLLNEDPKVQLHMRPRFVALFAFTFAMTIGALWEIFEFAMDELAGLNMQKSGLPDTMGDLIVDGVGSALVAVYGWYHLRTPGPSFLERWIAELIRRNPRIFRRRARRSAGERGAGQTSRSAGRR